MILQSDTPEEILEKFKKSRLHSWAEKEHNDQEQRARLRDSVVQLREPSHRPASSPASTAQPTFKIGEVKDFPFVAEPGTRPDLGNMSEKSAAEFYDALKNAASKPDVASRDAGVDKAANVVARDWATKHGLLGRHDKDGVLAHALHEGRAQAAFASREIGQKLGLNPVESTVIGYSLERALEKEGFKVIANHAIDASASLYRATASSVANSTGMRHSAETTLAKSLTWLSTHGVGKEELKNVIGKHAGKLSIIAEVSQHPEVVQRVALVMSKSDSLVDGALMLSKDAELRKSVGTLAMGAGETVAGLNKGVGSALIVAGSAMRGDSTEETARHAFRAALTILGGAAGGIAGGGVLSLGTGTIGAMAGSKLADALLDAYDKHLGKPQGPHAAAQDHTIHQQDVLDSSKVIANRVATRMMDPTKPIPGTDKLPSALLAQGKEMEREYTHSFNKGALSAKG